MARSILSAVRPIKADIAQFLQPKTLVLAVETDDLIDRPRNCLHVPRSSAILLLGRFFDDRDVIVALALSVDRYRPGVVRGNIVRRKREQALRI